MSIVKDYSQNDQWNFVVVGKTNGKCKSRVVLEAKDNRGQVEYERFFKGGVC
jgi:hypothetical protein